MRQTFKKWSNCFNYSRLPMLFIDSDFRILASNEAFRKSIGYTFEDLLSMNFIDLIPEKINCNKNIKKLIREDKYYSFIVSLGYYHKDKHVMKLPTCVNSFFDDSGNYEESLVILNPQEVDLRSIFFLN